MEKNKREFSLNAKNLASANLGQKIRFYRQIAGMTQKELGSACGVNESTIRNYELGNRYPDSDTIFEISNALEISPYVLATPDPISTILIQYGKNFGFDSNIYRWKSLFRGIFRN